MRQKRIQVFGRSCVSCISVFLKIGKSNSATLRRHYLNANNNVTSMYFDREKQGCSRKLMDYPTNARRTAFERQFDRYAKIIVRC